MPYPSRKGSELRFYGSQGPFGSYGQEPWPLRGLHWTSDGWKLTAYTQKDGPQPTDQGAEFGTAPQL
ncbi:hypothetical protein [Streptomyces mirabilis]|uniref:hypothetical protein n=1 Tax=Streptomyces mirabilis TaxID=68239 RepID=UPI0036C63406